MLRILRNLFAPAPSARIIKAREETYIRHFGAEPTVYHSTNWVFPHVDIYVFAPTAVRPWYALVTGGMAEYQQPVADNAAPVRVELILQVGTITPTAVNLLKMLAEYPARFDTFLAKYHTVPLGGVWSEVFWPQWTLRLPPAWLSNCQRMRSNTSWPFRSLESNTLTLARLTRRTSFKG